MRSSSLTARSPIASSADATFSAAVPTASSRSSHPSAISRFVHVAALNLIAQIYNLVTELLGIPEDQRAPNNGTAGFWRQYL